MQECTFYVDTHQKKSGFISCIYRTKKSYKINWFFGDYLLNREVHSKSSWNQYIDTLNCNSSQDKLRKSLRSQQELNSYVEVHKYLEPHSFLSRSLYYPKYTWQFSKLINFPLPLKQKECPVSFVKERLTI